MNTVPALPHGPLHAASRFHHLPSARPAPDPVRISAIAGAIAINIGVLLALLRPMDLPLPSLETLGQRVPVQMVDVRPKPLPPEKPPELVRDTRPDPAPRPPLPQTRAPTPAAPAVPVELPGAMDIPAEAIPPTHAAGTSEGSEAVATLPGPLTGANLALRDAPRPAYPRDALLDGRQGVVRLLVKVDREGRPLEVTVERSSGHRDLDQTARQQVLRRWRFHPAMHEGRAMEASGFVEVAFTLE